MEDKDVGLPNWLSSVNDGLMRSYLTNYWTDYNRWSDKVTDSMELTMLPFTAKVHSGKIDSKEKKIWKEMVEYWKEVQSEVINKPLRVNEKNRDWAAEIVADDFQMVLRKQIVVGDPETKAATLILPYIHDEEFMEKFVDKLNNPVNQV